MKTMISHLSCGHLLPCTHMRSHMTGPTGQHTVERLGSQDLNRDGEIINLAIVGSSRFYDFWVFEDVVGRWVDENGYPDLIIVGDFNKTVVVTVQI